MGRELRFQLGILLRRNQGGPPRAGSGCELTGLLVLVAIADDRAAREVEEATDRADGLAALQRRHNPLAQIERVGHEQHSFLSPASHRTIHFATRYKV
jgi:hypothetical protein